MGYGIITGNVLSAGVASLTLTPASVGAATTAEQTFTMPGVRVGDFVSVNKPTAQAGLAIGGCRVTAANTIGITFINPTAGSLTPTAGEVYMVRWVRPDSVVTGCVW